MSKEILHYDIAIIGSGIAGAGLASQFTDAKRICIIETEKQAGFHSTSRSAAMFIKGYGNQPIRHLTELSEPYYKSPEKLFTNQTLLSPRGQLIICEPGEEQKWQQELQFSHCVSHISKEKAHELVPLLKKDRIIDAVYDDQAADIDVDVIHQSALKQFKNQGGHLILNSEVRSLNQEGKGWTITTASHTITANIIINAAGAWADNIASLAGAKPCQLQPMRRSVAIVNGPEQHDFSHWPLFATMAEKWYARPQSGKLLISPAEEEPVDAHDAYPEDIVIAQALYDFEQSVDLSIKRIEHQWAGLRTFAPDRTPVVGFDPSIENFFWLAGQGGYGIQTAPALSKLAFDLIQQTPINDNAIEELVLQLSPNRFNQVA